MGWTEITAGWTLFTKVHKWWMDRKKKKAMEKEIDEHEKQHKEAKDNGSASDEQANGTGNTASGETRTESEDNG